MSNSEDNKAASIAKEKIEVWLAGVLMIIAFAVGFLINEVVSEPEAPTMLQQQPMPGLPGGIVPAGPLDSDQLEGELPANHPEVAPGQTAPGAPESSPATGGGGNGGGSEDAGSGNNNP